MVEAAITLIDALQEGVESQCIRKANQHWEMAGLATKGIPRTRLPSLSFGMSAQEKGDGSMNMNRKKSNSLRLAD